MDSPLLIEAAKISQAVILEHARLGYKPTNTEAAERLWRFTNAATTPVDVAEKLMRSLGYEPFQGFPLRYIK